jgi:hypothetical protein
MCCWDNFFSLSDILLWKTTNKMHTQYVITCIIFSVHSRPRPPLRHFNSANSLQMAHKSAVHGPCGRTVFHRSISFWILNFWIGLVTWICITLTSVFSVVSSADQFYWPQHIKAKVAIELFGPCLILLTFVFSKNDPLIYWHGGLYRPLISENDPQFYCQGGHRVPFCNFLEWTLHNICHMQLLKIYYESWNLNDFIYFKN